MEHSAKSASENHAQTTVGLNSGQLIDSLVAQVDSVIASVSVPICFESDCDRAGRRTCALCSNKTCYGHGQFTQLEPSENEGINDWICLGCAETL